MGKGPFQRVKLRNVATGSGHTASQPHTHTLHLPALMKPQLQRQEEQLPAALPVGLMAEDEGGLNRGIFSRLF